MIKQIVAGLFYGLAAFQFVLCFEAEDPSSHLIWGWAFWIAGTVAVVWDMLDET